MPTALTTVDVNGVTATLMARDEGEEAVSEYIQEGEGLRADVLFKVPWADRFNLLKALAGGASIVGGAIKITPPWPYPDSPTGLKLYAMSCGRITGIKFRRRDSDGWAEYVDAMVPVTFGIPKWGFDAADPTGQNDPSGQPWTTTRIKLSAEVLQPPGGSYYYVGTGERIPDSGVGLIRPRFEISLSRAWYPYVPLFEASSYLGSSNSVPVKIGNLTFPVGFLVFVGMDTERSFDTIGNTTQNIVYTIMGNSDFEFNKALYRDGTWKYLNTSNTGSGSYPFPYKDFWNNLP